MKRGGGNVQKNTEKSSENVQPNSLISSGSEGHYESTYANDRKGAKKVNRRTVTFDEYNEKNLNKLRGSLLAEKDKELDFTSAVNMVLSLGFNRLNSRNLNEEEYNIINNYMFGFRLKKASLDDEHWNAWIEYEYPEMIKRLEKLDKKESLRNSVKRTKKEDVPEPE